MFCMHETNHILGKKVPKSAFFRFLFQHFFILSGVTLVREKYKINLDQSEIRLKNFNFKKRSGKDPFCPCKMSYKSRKLEHLEQSGTALKKIEKSRRRLRFACVQKVPKNFFLRKFFHTQSKKCPNIDFSVFFKLS